MIMKNDHFSVGSLEVMPTDFRANIVRNAYVTLLTWHMVNTFDIGCVAVPISVADDQVFFPQPVCEIKATAKEMLARNRIAKRCPFSTVRPFNPCLRSFRFAIVHPSEVDRVFLKAGQYDGF